jgi:hypothetical protein
LEEEETHQIHQTPKKLPKLSSMLRPGQGCGLILEQVMLQQAKQQVMLQQQVMMLMMQLYSLQQAMVAKPSHPCLQGMLAMFSCQTGPMAGLQGCT